MLVRVVHQQVNVVVFAVHVNRRRFKIVANVGENGTKAVDGIFVKDPVAILCDKDQVNMKLKYAMSAVSNVT
jgi:hypothetical protein